jgi:hypothetical protein
VVVSLSTHFGSSSAGGAEALDVPQFVGYENSGGDLTIRENLKCEFFVIMNNSWKS